MQSVLGLTEDARRQNAPAMRHILVVDDEQPIVWMLQESLEFIPDCEILTATGGKEALHLCQEYRVDLLLTDYRMSDLDGLTLAGHVRCASPQTMIVMLTAHGNAALEEQAAAVGIQSVLRKPIKLAELRGFIQKVLSKLNPPSLECKSNSGGMA